MTFFLSTEYMAKKALTKTDIKNIENFYIKKVEQFNKFTLEELKVLYNKGRLSATEQRALFDVVNTKLQQRKEETITETIKQIKEESNETSSTTDDNSSTESAT